MPVLLLFCDEVAENAAFRLFEVPDAALHFLHQRRRHDRIGHQLRMRVIQPRTRRPPMILENDDARETRVALQILQPGPPGPEHAPQAIGLERVERLIVQRGFDDDFMSAEAVSDLRSEERRVGKEARWRWWVEQ